MKVRSASLVPRMAARIHRYLGKMGGAVTGFVVAGPWGVPLGMLLGHVFDRHYPQLARLRYSDAQQALFETTYILLGHLAKSDGVVSEAEIAACRRVMGRMGLGPQEVGRAIKLFTDGKQRVLPLKKILRSFKKHSCRHAGLNRLLLEYLMEVAVADERLVPAKVQFLREVCLGLGLPGEEWRRIYEFIHGHKQAPAIRHGAQALAQAYDIFQLSPEASNDDIKKAYRHLLKLYHPDKCQAQGGSEQQIALATRMTYTINAAYESLRQARGF